jgi:SAM-dependent methyltransferase
VSGTGGAATDAAGEALYENRARASSFGANAELYDTTRPRYPDALIDDLCTGDPTSILDVGCGTGLFGRSFVERGRSVTGVEPDPQMAEVARRHGLAVEVASFEDWDDAGRRFDLLVAGQAWHWVAPAAGAARARDVVAPGGTVALAWNVGAFDDDLGPALAALYERLARDEALPLVPHRRERGAEHSASELAFVDTGAFDGPDDAVYPWTCTYTAAEWLAQLETHSDHALMAPADRERLLAAVGAVIEERGGTFVMRYDCEVTRYTRR